MSDPEGNLEFNDGFRIEHAENLDAEKDSDFGKILAPYGGIEQCANSTCCKILDEVETQGAYMFRDVETGKMVIFCGLCAPDIELNHSVRFKLIPL